MKIWKLVSGILSIILFLVVTLQSCAAGLYDAMADTGETSGAAGVLVAILLLAGGIVSIAVRNSDRKGTNIALLVLFGLAALIGFAGYGSYQDLIIWSVWCLINALMAVISMVVGSGKAGGKKPEDSKEAKN
ncbi:MAG: hypothetical protein PUE04_07920 [Lachnospira sp.]|nr:hypothetical protein [Lachnospira sp.]